MKLRLEWFEFVDAAIEGLRTRGHVVTSLPYYLFDGDIIPSFVEIETEDRKKIGYETSIF